MSLSTFDDLKKDLHKFNIEHRRPHGELELTGLLDISTQARASWPSNEKPGVYVFLDSDRFISYIGKASHNIGSRLSARFDVKWNSKTRESSDCKYITTIPLPINVGFEASAIEEYLLENLNTKFNVIGNNSSFKGE